MTKRCLVPCLVLTALSLLAVPSASVATSIPGPNGKIVFASGRASLGIPAPSASDADARIWVADYPSGTPAQVTTLPAGTQHRHPNWSPDHTKIVYAAGVAFSGEYALWIVDLVAGTQTEFVSKAAMQDRPTWSPDGTRIAYGSGGDLYVKSVAAAGTGQGTQLTNTADIDERPVWSPDGQTLYFNRGPAADRDLYKITPVAPTGAVTSVRTGATSDWQPSVSPDGKRLCYLTGPQTNAAKLRTVNVDGSGDTPFTGDGLSGALNCVWSPDGTRILYTLGAFEAGDLVTRDINGGSFQALNSMNVASHFDGNADWATNFSPTCDPRDESVPVNGFVTVSLSCTDPDAGFGAEPPTPTALEGGALEISSPPAHGTLGGLNDGKVIYTPAKDFQGVDTFTYTGSDGTSDAPPATVTVRVGLEGGGAGDARAPTISRVTISARRWRLGPKLASISRAPLGTTVSFRLSEAATSTLTFQRALPGRRVGGRCAKPTAANRSHKACSRYRGAGRLSRPGKQGANHVKFQGRLSRSKTLKPGSYRVVVGAVDAAGNRAKPRTGPTFTIVS
jgi:Bacterial Ig domain/WD40-like Beta Propeller Repeat